MKSAVTPVPVFDERDKAWRWFATDSLYVKDGRVFGVLHREDGPAVLLGDGTRAWWTRGQRHREDGPALEFACGTRAWWIRGQRHREDGPAIEWADGTRTWWIRGQWFKSEEAWRRARGAKKRAR